ncbi:MAG TPA: hypothetical protein VEH00_04365 [Steroidobacteraceae bacterium]|nr:hypothetical protein [Steroidobacteraceae bacterium]
MLRKSSLAAHLSVAGVATAILTASLAFAQAADPAQEAATAGVHAGLAAQGAAIEQVHMHLHHTVNCLVGPKGEGFDAKEANPCQKLGNGAIPDTTDSASKAKLTAALAKAQAGLKSDDPAAAKKAAAEAQAALK